MKILPMLVFAAAAGVGSGVMSFKQVAQLNYENAKLALQVHNLESNLASLRKRWLAQEGLTDSSLPVTGDRGWGHAWDRGRRGRAAVSRREVGR